MVELGTKPPLTEEGSPKAPPMKEPEVLETVTPKPPVKPLGTGLFGTRPFDPKEILSEARDAMTVRRVFGEPIEKEGMTIVPVAQVMGGFGAGGPAETPPATTGVTAPAGTKPVTPTGVGGGFGVMARPMGVYVIREGRVRWVPSVDVSRLVFRMILGAAAILFVLRPVLMARVRAKAD